MLDFDKDENSSIIFETITTKQSTTVEGSGPPFQDLELDLIVIEVNQTFYKGRPAKYKGQTVLGLASGNDIYAVVNKLDKTIEDSNTLH